MLEEGSAPAHIWSEAKMHRKIWREMRLYVSPSALEVLLFIFGRTYMFAKSAEVIPIRHFLNGIQAADGGWLSAPVRMKRRMLFYALNELIDNDIIVVSKAHRTATPIYAINPTWQPTSAMECTRLVQPVAPTSVMGCTSNYNNKIITHRHEHVAHVRTQEASMIGDEIRAAAVSATQRNVNARTKRKAKLNATAMEKIWEDAFKETYPDEQYFKWRVYELSAFAKAVARGVPRDRISDFIEFSVGNFGEVLRQHFGWMKSKPKINPSFVTKHIHVFYQAFDDDRDPNKKIKRAIKDNPIRKPPTPKQEVSNDEVIRLRAENEALRQKVGETAVAKRKRLRRIIRERPTTHADFGSWEDK